MKILLDQILRVSQFLIVEKHVPLRHRDIRIPQPVSTADRLFNNAVNCGSLGHDVRTGRAGVADSFEKKEICAC